MRWALDIIEVTSSAGSAGSTALSPPCCLQVRARLQKMGSIAPMNIFLRQEIDRMQRVITIVRSTLQDLQLAIDGTIIMSEVSMRHEQVSTAL